MLVLVLAKIKNYETQTMIDLNESNLNGDNAANGHRVRPWPLPATAAARSTPVKVPSETDLNGLRQGAEICLNISVSSGDA